MYDDNDDNDEYFINSSQLDRQCQFTDECPINSTCNIHTNKCVCNFNHLWLNMDYSNKETEHMKSCEPFNCNDKPLLCKIFNSLKCNTTTGECVCLQNALEFDNFTQKCKLKPRDVIESALRSETFKLFVIICGCCYFCCATSKLFEYYCPSLQRPLFLMFLGRKNHVCNHRTVVYR